MAGETAKMRRKLEIARQELLDLGLRNPLLNYRTLKARGLEIVNESPADVYRMLVTEKRKMTFEPAEETEEPGDSLPENHLDSKLQTAYTVKQLESRLLGTYYYSRTYIEEQGVNILYMALGMLRWFESDGSQEARKAPLILVPVQVERVSAKERFTVAYTEDEVGANISLAAKMKAEFGIDVPAFPEDGELDVKAYFSEVEKSVAGERRWSVDPESIAFGFFSFGKFLMYRDLDAAIWPEHTQPEKHPVLTAILEDGFREAPSDIAEDESIDRRLKLTEARHVMDADSSQIIAIMDAMQGRNMVIQGPPGTGKSQTITNLIAEAIGRGKKVLFVSEKMAALEVVKRRLDRLGLGVACLELHSHKTNKKALLQELASTLELGKPKYKDDDGDIRLLEELRARLNEYCAAVNDEVGTTGVSPYRALGELVRYMSGKTEAPFPHLSLPSVGEWSKESVRKREAIVEELQSLTAAIGVPKRHPFRGSKLTAALPADIGRLRSAVADAADRTAALADAVRALAAELRCPAPEDLPEAFAFLDVLQRAADAPELERMALRSPKWAEEADLLLETVDAGRAYKGLIAAYESVLIPEAWDQQLLDARPALAKYRGKWWGFLSGEYRKAKRRVSGLCKDPSGSDSRLLEIVDAVMEARRLKEKIARCESAAMELFPSEWRGADTKWERLSDAVPWIVELHRDISTGKLPGWTFDLLSASPNRGPLGKRVSAFAKQADDARRALDFLTELLEFDRDIGRQPFDSILSLLRTWTEQAPRLQEIVSFNHLTALCAEEELRSVADLAEAWESAGTSLLDAFRWNRYQGIVSRAFRERPALANFERSRHEHAVQKFRELDRYVAEFNRAKLAEEHWKRLPQHEAGGQLGVLRREFEKKTRHLPIRQLMLKAGHAIQAIKPVFMMGPLSIASYLQPGSLEFDLVIFDEASQVKPVDAFGAIIRGKQAVVVGDSKQMPPTDFFDSIAKEEEEDEDRFVSDMESILGLFVGQNAPQRMLRWHYRSRHESLITVSNHEFYENKLVVFPSPDADKRHSGLKCNYLPDTAYDRGRSRTNKQEAKAVAAAVLEHAKLHPNLTLGVTAFSIAQMQAILDEIEALRRANPALDTFVASHPHEPFFVKNLENVQGDERDVIFISLGYGKTSEGYLAMDFGALNREGGERRLNVLITRARIRCEVFTNLRSDDIDLNRTGSKGVKSLKTFLKYAESGSLDVPAGTGRTPDSPFEEAVYRSLVDAGYEVAPQVGSAGFFIDLAVVDPDSPGRFLLGIECDGAAYHSARSARDRDRLRQEVLEGLGWIIHRIWSADWFRNPERELRRVAEEIEKAKVKAKTERIALERQREAEADSSILREAAAEKEPGPRPERYRTAELSIDLQGKELHALPASAIGAWVYEVVRTESPVHATEVMKRICEAAGIKRAGSRIQEAVARSFSYNKNIERRGDFLWLTEMNTPAIRDRTDMKQKKIELISDEEYEAAVTKAIQESFGAEEDAVIAAAYQSLGFARVTEDMRTYLQAIVSSMLARGSIARRDHLLVLESAVRQG